MSIKKQTNGTYLVDIRPTGTKGTRVRKRFDTQSEAKRFEKHTLAQADDKAWQPEKVDNRRLDELIELWFNLHGQALSDGKKRKNKLLAMSLMMRNPIAKNITASDFSKYRQLLVW